MCVGLAVSLVFAAALILATCITENPPELVAQSRPGSAPQDGQRKDTGLTGGGFRLGDSSDIARAYALPDLPATETWGSNFKGGVLLESSLREQRDQANCFRRATRKLTDQAKTL
jgi:hypothetical protein